ncbi:serine/arginine repetitive matrix protein 2-like isoform X3 [Biomphalaria glabrata]|uniref:Serine/arginine repetitive matrix protein 2-like isoform X3 n=1 Tax=Biomphalaria glabrata TaxID=6526 RepID=A0A9W2YV63_BIOGL|nr:serine/arginine repetitive matrix protein 2-like isoform X3 [Biomphalaria glabrata]
MAILSKMYNNHQQNRRLMNFDSDSYNQAYGGEYTDVYHETNSYVHQPTVNNYATQNDSYTTTYQYDDYANEGTDADYYDYQSQNNLASENSYTTSKEFYPPANQYQSNFNRQQPGNSIKPPPKGILKTSRSQPSRDWQYKNEMRPNDSGEYMDTWNMTSDTESATNKLMDNADIKEEIEEEKKEKEEEEDDDDEPIITHSKGLMNTLIGLCGPEVKNRKPDPLPPPQPMKLENEEEKYLGKKSSEAITYSDDYLEYGITETMLEEANLEMDDVPCHARDLLPSDIGKDADKPELFCKLCQVQTTSMGNFRDHLNGRSHKNTLEAFKQGKKVSSKKKRNMVDPANVGQKSVSLELVEGLLEPILGLSYITEYHSLSGILCVCNLCGVKFDRNIVVSHVTGVKHRLHYMKEKKPAVYVHLKKFGGKKSQLSSFLDELSVDAEKEDGRGVPTIKIFELPDGTEEGAAEKHVPPEDKEMHEATLALKRHEAMLARRKPGAISFQEWVNEEFNKSKSNKKRSPSPSSIPISRPDIGNQGTQGNIRPLMSIPSVPAGARPLMSIPSVPASVRPLMSVPSALATARPLMEDAAYRGQPIDTLISAPLALPTDLPPRTPFPQPPLPYDPYLDPTRFRPEPFRDPFEAARLDPYVLKSYPYPDPVQRFRRVDTSLDPDPLKRCPPKKDTIIIDYGHGQSKSSDAESSSKYTIKSDGRDESRHREEKNKSVSRTVDQWENDILRMQNMNVKAPDSLAMLSSTYSSPEKSPSPSRGKQPVKHRELPFSKSYLESSKLKSLDKHRRSQDRYDYHQKKQRSPESDLSRKYGSSSHSRNRSRSPDTASRRHDQYRGYTNDTKYDSTLNQRRSFKSPGVGQGKRSRSPPPVSHSRRSRSRSPLAGKSRRSKSPNSSRSKRSRSPSLGKYSHRASSSSHYSRYESEASNRQRPIRSPEVLRNSKKREESPSQIKREMDVLDARKEFERNRHAKQLQEIFTEENEDVQAERIAELLVEMSSSWASDMEHGASALQKLLSNAAIQNVLMSSKSKPESSSSSGQSRTASRLPTSSTHQPKPRDKVAFSLSGNRGTSKPNTLPSDFGESSDSSS